jgi:hypothetical protein
MCQETKAQQDHYASGATVLARPGPKGESRQGGISRSTSRAWLRAPDALRLPVCGSQDANNKRVTDKSQEQIPFHIGSR